MEAAMITCEKPVLYGYTHVPDDMRADSVDAIALRLRATRKALGLSQAELCRRIAIAPNTWNQWERGKGRVSIDEALKICEALGVSLDWIYRGKMGELQASLFIKISEYMNKEERDKRIS